MERKRRLLYVGEFSGLSTGYATISKNLLAEFIKTGQYEVAELASYYKENEPAHQQLARQFPWRIYGNLPANDHEKNIYNSHPQNEFCRWKFDYVCLDFQPDIVCFDGNTPVITNNGVKNINNINIGDQVLTHQGRYRKVTKVFERHNVENLLEINTSHNNQILKVTKEHLFLVVRRDFDKRIPNVDHIKPEWVEAKDLQKGYLACLPKQTTHNSFECPWEVARLIGYYAAEGCILYKEKKEYNHKKGIQLNFNWKEKSFIEEIIHISLKFFDIRIISLKKKGSNGAVLRIYSEELANFIYYHVPGLSGTKTFSEEIFNSNQLIQQEVLTGLLRGGGGYNERRAYFCTKSRNLAYQTFIMLLNFDILPSMGYNQNHIKDKKFFRYVFGFNDISRDNFIQLYEGSYNYKHHKRINNNYAFLTIKEVKEGKVVDKVYNLEVEEDNSYVTTIVCHNCAVRDPWMDSFIDQSPFRKFFQFVWMPTVDSISQNMEWIDQYIKADHILTYTNFAYKVLQEEGGGLIPLKGVATPAVDINVYKPVANKRQHKESFGLSGDSLIIGMVARNQRRKLFPDLIQAFREFISKAHFKDTNKVYLYLHTAYPDLGWNLPKYFQENGLAHKVLMTYFCHACRHWFPSFYGDALTLCKFCGQKSALLSNSQIGIETEALAAVYNFMDLYVQFVTNEGLGIPCVEAAACGIPICGTYYSGVEDLLDNLQGKKITAKLWHEADTGRQLAYPSINELVEYIDEFTSLPESIRMRMSRQTSELTKKYYGGWSSVAKTWIDIFDAIVVPENNPWLSPINIVPTQSIQIPPADRVSDEQFVGWCLQDILHRPDWVNSYTGLKLLRDLSWGRTIVNNLGFFTGELSQLGQKPMWEACDRSKIMDFVKGLREQYNQSEQMRHQYILNGKIKNELS